MKKLIFFVSLAMLNTFCRNGESPSPDCKECPKNFSCTLYFGSIAVTVKDLNGNPVAFDEYYTLKKSNGLKIDLRSFMDSTYKASGNYPVLDDAYIHTFSPCGEEFIFVGIKNNKELVNQTYTIKHDCCHVKLAKGDTELIVNVIN